MIRRKKFNKFRGYLCSGLAAFFTVRTLANGGDNSFRTVMLCATLGIFAYAIMWAIDRALGTVAPLIIDLRSSARLDRSDPYHLIVKPEMGDDIVIDIDTDDTVKAITVGETTKHRAKTNEFCYLQIGDNRYIKIDSEYAYMLVRLLRQQHCKPRISGITYQT